MLTTFISSFFKQLFDHHNVSLGDAIVLYVPLPGNRPICFRRPFTGEGSGRGRQLAIKNASQKCRQLRSVEHNLHRQVLRRRHTTLSTLMQTSETFLPRIFTLFQQQSVFVCLVFPTGLYVQIVSLVVSKKNVSCLINARTP